MEEEPRTKNGTQNYTELHRMRFIDQTSELDRKQDKRNEKENTAQVVKLDAIRLKK